MTATEFRRQLYRALDKLSDEGGEIIITHKNRSFRIVPEPPIRFEERLVRHDTLNVDPEAIVESDAGGWQWNEGENVDALP